jgi:hypothetical protein
MTLYRGGVATKIKQDHVGMICSGVLRTEEEHAEYMRRGFAALGAPGSANPNWDGREGPMHNKSTRREMGYDPSDNHQMAGRHKTTPMKVKTLKKMLKSKGLKVSGKKSTLRARARKARLIGTS